MGLKKNLLSHNECHQPSGKNFVYLSSAWLVTVMDKIENWKAFMSQTLRKEFYVFTFCMTGDSNGQERKLESFHKRFFSHLCQSSEKHNGDVTHIWNGL